MQLSGKDTRGHRFTLAVAAATGLVLAMPTALAGPAVSASTPMVISLLSTRADLVSGDQALVAITLPSGATNSPVQVTLNGRIVTSAFTLRSGQVLEGLVNNLSLGPNVLAAQLPNGSGAQITITNHPNGGPVLSSPQLQPWTCEPGAADAQCDRLAQYTYVYKSSDPTKSGFQPYDPAHPATDVATTTTDQGITVPFIVRVETGYQDRDQYAIAVLFQPGRAWGALTPQRQFNHKLLITHGASCDLSYQTASAPSVTSYNPADLLGLGPVTSGADSGMYALGAGFAVMSTALDNNGHDCDVVIQAESLLMAKEHLIDNYGTLRYTIGTGCSGGSLAQQWIANAYPGIYQGILPTCSFPDTWSSATQVMDYHLLRAYFENSSHWGPGIVWSPSQWAPVEGNQLPLDAIVSDIGFFDAIVPTHSCGGISDAQRYDAKTNPGGIRCSVADMAINVFGPRPPSDWSANERKLGHGFAGVPADNLAVE